MTPSIQGRLLAWLSAVLLLSGLLIGYATYRRAQHDLDDLLDYQLKQLAFSLSHQSFAGAPPPPETLAPEPDFITQVWGRDGVLMFYSQPNLSIPMLPEPGFRNVTWSGQAYRVYTELDGSRIIQVAHPLSLRKEMAADLARRAVLPLIVLLPLLAIGIWIIVRRALHPLSRISAGLRARSPSALQPLTEQGLPEELTPMVRSLNDLLERLQGALEAQRQFVADAAHELRSPLTAVHLQLQLLKRADSEEERSAALERLDRGVQRSAHLVRQLLTLARQDPHAPAVEFAPVDLVALTAEIIRDFEPLALRKGIALSLQNAGTTSLRGDKEGLRAMLSNLIDNAIRYTLGGGSVSVEVQQTPTGVLIKVEDTGPGIPEAQRERVFDRFYRAPAHEGADEGSGLGLAIVKRVVDRHRGTILLDSGKDGKGLRFSVFFSAGNS